MLYEVITPDAFQMFEDVDLDAWRHIVDVNLFGTLQLTKSIIPTMKKQSYNFV